MGNVLMQCPSNAHFSSFGSVIEAISRHSYATSTFFGFLEFEGTKPVKRSSKIWIKYGEFSSLPQIRDLTKDEQKKIVTRT